MDRYKELLDLAFELEGLVRLRLEREKDEALEDLISDKVRAICSVSGLDCREMRNEAAEACVGDDGTADVTAGSDEMFYSLPDECDEYEAEEVEKRMPEPEISGSGRFPAKGRAASERPKPLLSVNDRFRFRRELFSNSDPDFNAALDLVATMDSYDEAEDYFYNDLEWNPEDAVVVEFMTLLTRYFKK